MTTYKILARNRRKDPIQSAWSGIEAENPVEALKKVHKTKRTRHLDWFEVIAESNISEYELGRDTQGRREFMPL